MMKKAFVENGKSCIVMPKMVILKFELRSGKWGVTFPEQLFIEFGERDVTDQWLNIYKFFKEQAS